VSEMSVKLGIFYFAMTSEPGTFSLTG